MGTRFIPALTLAIAVAASGTARAQFGYPGGYGGYGWGGWGSTPQGDIARGLGAFNLGAGQGNLLDAQAQSINTDTVLRWNQAAWESQHALNVSNYLHLKQRQAAVNRAQAATYDRLRNHPEIRDIQDGDSLNVLLDILTNPAVSHSSYRMLRTPLSREVILDIPFEYASEAMTICLDQITGKESWPLALRDDAFTADRQRLQDAVKAALDEDERDDLRPKTIRAVTDAISALRKHFEASVPATDPSHNESRDYLKSLAGLTRMLYSPKVDEILAELEKYQGTTVSDLIAFMQAFNLRFAPARSFRQRQIYTTLYTILDNAVDGPLSNVSQNVEQTAKNTFQAMAKAGNNFGKGVERDANSAISTAEKAGAAVGNDVSKATDNAVQTVEKAGSALSSAASAFFRGMSWDHLESPPKPQ